MSFWRKPHFGLDMASDSVKIVGMEQRRDDWEVTLAEEIPLNFGEDIFRDDSELYVEALCALDKKYNLKKARLFATLPSREAMIENIKINLSETQDVSEAIEKELELRGLPEPVENVQIACHETGFDEKSQSIALLVCAVPLPVIDSVKRVFKESGLTLTSLELDALTAYNVFEKFYDAEEACALVNIGSNYTTCILMHPEKAPFFYNINLGGDDINDRIGSLCLMPDEQTEQLTKRMYVEKWQDTEGFQASELCSVNSDFALELSYEVKRCTRHYQTREGLERFGTVYLTGGCAKVSALPREFEKLSGLKTAIWNPLDAMNKEKLQTGGSLGLQLSAAIGAAFGGGWT